MGNANIEVGNCKFTELYFAGDDETAVVHEAPGVTKWGEFTAQCYLNAASDSCGHPFCDQMVLEASGGGLARCAVLCCADFLCPVEVGRLQTCSCQFNLAAYAVACMHACMCIPCT